jgi:alpha-tubulin suppressor-like RCC1 family protein
MKSLIQSCGVLPLVSFITLFGCGAAPTGDKPEDVGEVSLALTTVPTGVQCIQVVASGTSTVTKNFTVTAGSSGVNVLALGALPVGGVTVTGKAYNVACSSISGQTATWIADTLSINVQAGAITSPIITFRPNNTVTATASFVGNVVQVAASGVALDIVYSDGTVRGSGDQSLLGLGQQANFAALSSLTNVSSLVLGQFHGCALLKTGSVSCYGNNSDGELGNGTTTSSTAPVVVTGLTNVVQIAAGLQHTCALKSEGSLWCWGGNAHGQIGNGTTNNAITPVQVLTSVSYVAAGSYHTCALWGGKLRCWGENSLGQLGNGTTASPVTWPESATLSAVTQLALGFGQSCALRADGDVFCWGNNAYGQLGYGDTNSLLTAGTTPVLTGVQQLSSTEYGICALLDGGLVMCWGEDSNGEVGDGTGSTAILSPAFVANDYATFTKIFGSKGLTTCGIGTNAKVYCWGTNGAFLTNGNPTPLWVPTALGI